MSEIEKLKEDYKDDIIASEEERRKYRMITNTDGTVSFVDATQYQQRGTNYGAGDVNKTNRAINLINESLSDKENPIIMEKIVKTPGITLNAFEGKALSSSALTPPTVEGYKSIGLASGWGDGQIGLLVSPNGWVANCTNVKKTYDSVTLKFLYLKTF
jgi:hypothetical protein